MKHAILLMALSLSMFACAENRETPQREKERVQCQAITKSGNRCKRRAAPGKCYCRQHASDVAPKTPAKRCRAMTEDGKQCESKPLEGKNYCEKHMDK